MKLNWTKEALQRLQAIEEYIARDNIKVAGEFVDKLTYLAETIADNPRKGRVVPELSIENIRELLHKNYRIVYLVKKSSIEILTVFEGHQLLKKDEVLKK
ncbi:MAG: type II toxin-antitoxin system RelE/ParE family toxin [Ignavibacteriaceae bacterium]|jgi:addiction module RelE/StbE family toxin|nr:type II toxin-antitoxin system RelE/ParE family toxin [Ignavibacteriaceae bacterium]